MFLLEKPDFLVSYCSQMTPKMLLLPAALGGGLAEVEGGRLDRHTLQKEILLSVEMPHWIQTIDAGILFSITYL